MESQTADPCLFKMNFFQTSVSNQTRWNVQDQELTLLEFWTKCSLGSATFLSIPSFLCPCCSDIHIDLPTRDMFVALRYGTIRVPGRMYLGLAAGPGIGGGGRDVWMTRLKNSRPDWCGKFSSGRRFRSNVVSVRSVFNARAETLAKCRWCKMCLHDEKDLTFLKTPLSLNNWNRVQTKSGSPNDILLATIRMTDSVGQLLHLCSVNLSSPQPCFISFSCVCCFPCIVQGSLMGGERNVNPETIYHCSYQETSEKPLTHAAPLKIRGSLEGERLQNKTLKNVVSSLLQNNESVLLFDTDLCPVSWPNSPLKLERSSWRQTLSADFQRWMWKALGV